MASGVYKIQHKASGRCYVGSAMDFASRWREHRRKLNLGTHHNRPLANAWSKYGPGAFRFSMLERCEPERLLEREQAWMDGLRPYYNVRPVAGSRLGASCSDQHRSRISAANKGRVFSAEAREKMSKAKRGAKLSLRHRQNISQSMKGNTNQAKRHKESTKRKMSVAQKAIAHRRLRGVDGNFISRGEVP